MRIAEKRIQFLKSSKLTRIIFTLFGASYDSFTDRFFSIVLISSSLLLASVSIYTTWLGLSEYLPSIFAFFVSTGVQGLLVVVSWKIGSTLYTNKVKPALVIIYLLTFSTSVFFSYSALLDNIYSKDQRDSDELEKSLLKGASMTNALLDGLKSKATELYRPVEPLIVSLNQDLTKILESHYAPVKNDFDKNYNVYHGMLKKIDLEKEVGITPLNSNGRIRYSRPGNEDFARDYTVDAMNYYISSGLKVLEIKIREIDSLRTIFEESHNNLISSPQELTSRNVSEYLHLYNRILSNLQDSEVISLPSSYDSLQNKLSDLDAINRFLSWHRDDFNLFDSKTVEEVKSSLLVFMANYPQSILPMDQNSMIAEVGNLGKLGGSDAHPFILATGEFHSGNPLATGSLMLALIIDGLLLFMGIVGSKPDSFLRMRSVDDLDKVNDYALETYPFGLERV